MNSAEDRRKRILAINDQSTLAELGALARESFEVHFGPTSDQASDDDILGEALEFVRALSHAGRTEEAGDLAAALLAWTARHSVSLAESIRETLLKIERRADIYATHGDKKRVAIYGGSFDMPHNGHVAAAKAVLDSNLGIEEVWFMPAYDSRKQLTPARHRAAMCRLLQTLDHQIRFFGYELDHKLSNDTRHTLLRLSCEPFADQHRFFFMVSMDVANSISSWRGGEELKRAAVFITLPRPGYNPDLDNPWYVQQPHRYLAGAKNLVELSSSQIRQLYREGRFNEAASFVPAEIHDYICTHHLYRPHGHTTSE
ncbi:MAG TPA: nicotinate-nicotinamide nucleotide adenylyltransferase [Patescibacteria group bacterium]|nr:nicotinate-nicotinamide nucleotide adenylyltransferase [Patescibacteria group bacterium]